jgi:hypothetical protein
MKQKVFVKFPITGLGNLLLHWAKGYAFAKEHQLELYISAWWSFKPGPWIRGEKNKRLYWGYFKEEPLSKRIGLFFFKLGAKIIYEPTNIDAPKEKVVYVFKKFHVEKDYFKEIKPHRDELKTTIYEMLTPAIKAKLLQYHPPVIGVHIRRGDFKLGSTITPNSFFINAINVIRKECKQELPVTIFTDGTDEELKDVFQLPNVKRAEPKPDILDILLLSQSKICILSISSTFSFWGAFLNDGVVIKSPHEWHPDIRPLSVNDKAFEGALPLNTEKLPNLLIENLLTLK